MQDLVGGTWSVPSESTACGAQPFRVGRASGRGSASTEPLAALNRSRPSGAANGVPLGPTPQANGPRGTPTALRSDRPLPAADPTLAFPGAAAVLALLTGTVQEAAVNRSLASTPGALDSAGSTAGIAFRHVLYLPFGASGYAPIPSIKTPPRTVFRSVGSAPILHHQDLQGLSRETVGDAQAGLKGLDDQFLLPVQVPIRQDQVQADRKGRVAQLGRHGLG